MSAYLVDNSTINTVLSFIDVKSMGSDTYLSKIDGYNTLGKENLEQLGREMHDLNINALNQRYKENDPDPGYRYIFTIPPHNKCQILKSLQCWLYQCAEGDILETSKLYKAMRDYERKLMNEIISKTEQYQTAKWA